ncbi:Transcription initiation factor TFIID subunit 9 [Neocucurbitaria cava]|uniref:Transcription initiation factor TFIID subunit 9 n=1 Tax=Neocucurbitaria cava TaxID=798079 RepID=A0A9W8Y3T3_9PLEO|nr:Transcription initiation factor TFIID subunit 9 [Neocucurbitaria cava]
MASPAAETMQNGISTPPTTTNANATPPTQSSTQPNTQQASQLSNGAAAQPPPPSQPPSMNASLPSTSLSDTGASKRPRDARLIHLILANMGVHAYTERVPLQLLDFAYRYTSGILSDAISYEPPAHASTTSKKRGADKGGDDDGGGVSLNALRTAVGARAASTFTAQLGKEFMTEIASERNRIALPRVEREFGVRLPPERYCFTGVGWDVKNAWEGDEVSEDEEMDLGDEAGGSGVPGLEGRWVVLARMETG